MLRVRSKSCCGHSDRDVQRESVVDTMTLRITMVDVTLRFSVIEVWTL